MRQRRASGSLLYTIYMLAALSLSSRSCATATGLVSRTVCFSFLFLLYWVLLVCIVYEYELCRLPAHFAYMYVRYFADRILSCSEKTSYLVIHCGEANIHMLCMHFGGNGQGWNIAMEIHGIFFHEFHLIKNAHVIRS